MIQEVDGPLVQLVNVSGYQYPLPPKVKPKSLNPKATIRDEGRFKIVEWPQLQLDGVTTVTFKTIARAPSVLVIPVRSDGQVMLVHTIQPGSLPYFGFVAGDLEPAEDKTVFDGAVREFLQETGYTAKRFHVVYFHQFVAGWDWYAYTIIAEDCEKIQEPRPDFGEKCRPYFVTVDDLEKMSRAEQFLYPPILVNKLLLRNEGEKLRRLFRNPHVFAAMTYTPEQ